MHAVGEPEHDAELDRSIERPPGKSFVRFQGLVWNVATLRLRSILYRDHCRPKERGCLPWISKPWSLEMMAHRSYSYMVSKRSSPPEHCERSMCKRQSRPPWRFRRERRGRIQSNQATPAHKQELPQNRCISCVLS